MAKPTRRDPIRTGTLADRFWRCVTKSKKKSDCWPWQGTINNHGYGQLTFTEPASDPLTINSAKIHSAHRLSWQIANGDIPPNTTVRHTCGNKRCVNPAHLSLKTLRSPLGRK